MSNDECKHDGGYDMNGIGMHICKLCRADITPDEPKPKRKRVRPAPRPVHRGINNGFWDRRPEDRAAAMDAACRRAGVSNFHDLSPEERGAAYDDF